MYYNLSQLARSDSDFRNRSLQLMYKYKLSLYLSDDFVSEMYLKVEQTYFNKVNGWCSHSGAIQVLTCLVKDYLKTSVHTKTHRGTENEPYNFDTIPYEELDLQKEIELNEVYDSQIDAVTSLNETDINTILLTCQNSYRQAAEQTDRSLYYLKQNKPRILKYLNNQLNTKKN